MEYVEWERTSIAVPKGFEKELPLFQVIEGYKLRLEDCILEADKCFSISAGDSYRVSYEDARNKESVQIYGGLITHVSNLELPPSSTRILQEESVEIIETHAVLDYLRKVSENDKNPNRTYHNIKRHQERLRELPYEWQESLSAIYEGNGEFVVSSLKY